MESVYSVIRELDRVGRGYRFETMRAKERVTDAYDAPSRCEGELAIVKAIQAILGADAV